MLTSFEPTSKATFHSVNVCGSVQPVTPTDQLRDGLHSRGRPAATVAGGEDPPQVPVPSLEG